MREKKSKTFGFNSYRFQIYIYIYMFLKHIYNCLNQKIIKFVPSFLLMYRCGVADDCGGVIWRCHSLWPPAHNYWILSGPFLLWLTKTFKLH